MRRSEDRPLQNRSQQLQKETGQVGGLDFSTVLRWKTAAGEGGIQL
jgi:hypothetical protein